MGHDSMVGTALTIEREIEDTWNTRDTGVGNRREDQLSPCNTPKYTLAVFDMFRVFCKHNLKVS